MIMTKKERLFHAVDQLNALRCPVCGNQLVRSGDSLCCEKRHSLNVNRKGFINVLSRQTESCYDDGLFQARQRVFASGCYAPVLQAINELMPEGTARLLDAGCGEGWWLNQLLTLRAEWTGVGVDLSREAIVRATDWPCTALWMLGDLCHLPFADASFDVLLDVLTPASYEEFRRLLKPEGVIIKVYPGDEYLREIREKRGLKLYQSGQVDAYLREKTDILETKHVVNRCTVTPSLWQDFVRMTPLNQDLDAEALQTLAADPAETVTVDLHLTKAIFRK